MTKTTDLDIVLILGGFHMLMSFGIGICTLMSCLVLAADFEITYRKIPNVSPGLIKVFKHFLVGLYSGGAYIRGGLYSEGILC